MQSSTFFKIPIGLFSFTNLTDLTDFTNLHLTDLYDNLVDQILFYVGCRGAASPQPTEAVQLRRQLTNSCNRTSLHTNLLAMLHTRAANPTPHKQREGQGHTAPGLYLCLVDIVDSHADDSDYNNQQSSHD